MFHSIGKTLNPFSSSICACSKIKTSPPPHPSTKCFRRERLEWTVEWGKPFLLVSRVLPVTVRVRCDRFSRFPGSVHQTSLWSVCIPGCYAFYWQSGDIFGEVRALLLVHTNSKVEVRHWWLGWSSPYKDGGTLTCVGLLLYLLHINYQIMHTTSKVRTLWPVATTSHQSCLRVKTRFWSWG